MSRLLALLLLVGVYLLALASLDPLDALAGVLIGAALLIWLRGFLLGGEPLGAAATLRRCLAFFPFAAMTIAEIVRGTWRVSLIVVGLRPLRRPGIVLIPIGERTETGVAVTALAITLSPGELLVDIDEGREAMLIHVLDASEPDAVRAHYDHFYRRWQSKVFP
jgi:multicomponent Na+:H+ antiporter subunit E